MPQGRHLIPKQHILVHLSLSEGMQQPFCLLYGILAI